MNKMFLRAIPFLLVFFCAFQTHKIPEAEISNELINAHFYLPDVKNGYYRSTRFDWSGLIYSLEYKGHSYFGKWFEKYSPTVHDAIMGPVDSFDPLNYRNAMPGDTFVKVGVGTLTKLTDERYNGFTTYPIHDSGTWKVTAKDTKIEFLHVLNDKDYPYEYSKTINLIEGKSEMIISYALKNTGTKSIKTQVFNHNFFVIDSQVTGPDFEVTFAQNISGEGRGIGEIATLDKNKINFKRTLGKGESVYCSSLEGLTGIDDYNIQIENHKTGAGVRITGDRELSKMVFWSSASTVCPEPYIRIKVAPGETFEWSNKYEFFVQ